MEIIANLKMPTMKILLFGSHAKNLAHPESDIDLCLVVADGADCRALRLLANKHMGLAGLAVDVIVLGAGELASDMTSPLIHEVRMHSKQVG